MPAAHESVLTSRSFPAIRFLIVVRLSMKRPFLVFAQICVKPEEIERLRPSETTRLPVSGGVPSELDQSCLLGVQLQRELCEPLAQVGQEPLGVLTMLEAHNEVVRPAHDDHVAVSVAAPPLLGPQVKDVVQVDIRKQRRNRRPLRCPLLTGRPGPVLDHACPEPFLDQAQDPSVRYPVLEKPRQPRMIQAGEAVADVRVEHPVHLPLQDPGRERIQRIVRAAPRTEPIGETEEVRLVDGVQHLDDGPLDDLVLQRGDTERPKPPVRLRDVRPARWSRPVRPPVQPRVQIPEVDLQVLPVVTATSPRPPPQRPSGSKPGRPPAGDPGPRDAGAR